MENSAIVISLINAKGGVGKTTISSNMSHILSCAGYKVLHIDLDPQGSSSELIRPRKSNGAYLNKDEVYFLDMFSLLTQPVNVANYIFSTDYENLDVIPNARSTRDSFDKGSFDVQMERLKDAGKYTAFFENINSIRGAYDYIIIDGQPSMNEIMKVSVIASDYILSPASADLFNLTTVADTCSIIDMCNSQFNRDIEYLGFFFNRVQDLKDNAYNEVREFYLNRAKEYFIDNPVRFSKSIDKAALNKKLWLDYATNGFIITFPNPCKDLLRLMYKELQVIDDEHRDILVEKGIKKAYFE